MTLQATTIHPDPTRQAPVGAGAVSEDGAILAPSLPSRPRAEGMGKGSGAGDASTGAPRATPRQVKAEGARRSVARQVDPEGLLSPPPGRTGGPITGRIADRKVGGIVVACSALGQGAQG